MAETVNTSALLLSDGQGGYSKAFMESMTDIVKLQDGRSLTEKLTEIDGKLPITLTSGTLPETLGFGKVAFACDSSEKMTILAGKIDESVVEILTSESGVLRYEEVSGETVNPFTVDADTLGGSTKGEIISEAQSGIDLSGYATNDVLSSHTGNKNNPHGVTATQIGAAPSSHTHAAGDITSGTFDAARIPSLAASKIGAGTLNGKVNANSSAQSTVTTAQLRDIYAGTSDIGAGASLTSGRIYLVYE